MEEVDKMKGSRLSGHGLEQDGHSCRCGKRFEDMRAFSRHCATVQRRKGQPMDVAHTERRAWT